MTIAMPDSITPDNLPPGYPAYLGYVDGRWPTAAVLKDRFPAAHILSLTVKGGSAVADGCDVEQYDLTPPQGVAWAAGRLANGADRPAIYASAGTMTAVVSALTARGIAREHVRLLSAHYGAGEHICGPATCKLVSSVMDGTQWTDHFPGAGGSWVDMSVLADDFFGTTNIANAAWMEFDMGKLKILKQGDVDQAGAFWSVHRLQALLKEVGLINGVPAASSITVDGDFGAKTRAAVVAIQERYRISQDGVCGPQTWDVLLTGAS